LKVARNRLPFPRDSTAKIQNLRVASFRDEDVGGLDVAMNNPFRVRGVKSIGHINRDG
jgi:hypothetical protein